MIFKGTLVCIIIFKTYNIITHSKLVNVHFKSCITTVSEYVVSRHRHMMQVDTQSHVTDLLNMSTFYNPKLRGTY